MLHCLCDLIAVEAWKYCPFHGIWFSNKIFSFFSLVRDFLKNEISKTTIFNCLQQDTDLLTSLENNNHKSYFLITKIWYVCKFYWIFCLFVCFLWKIHNDSVGFTIPAMKNWSIYIKSLVASPISLVLFCSSQSWKDIIR